MKKNHTHLETGIISCGVCSKPIKLNVEERHPEKSPKTYLCYKHYKMLHPGHSGRDYRTWPKKENLYVNSDKGKRAL